ncbi:hypothetical protein ACTXT7_006279 [Hymenolepis weldensis]
MADANVYGENALPVDANVTSKTTKTWMAKQRESYKVDSKVLMMAPKLVLSRLMEETELDSNLSYFTGSLFNSLEKFYFG